LILLCSTVLKLISLCLN